MSLYTNPFMARTENEEQDRTEGDLEWSTETPGKYLVVFKMKRELLSTIRMSFQTKRTSELISPLVLLINRGSAPLTRPFTSEVVSGVGT